MTSYTEARRDGANIGDGLRPLAGMIDPHIHSAPDERPRLLTDLEVGRQAAAAGMRAIVLKSHVTLTVDRAALVEEVVGGGLRIFGGLALNRAVGGLNRPRVEAAFRMGARIIWLPTNSATTSAPTREGWPGIALLNERDKLAPALGDIFALVAAADAVLATGHVTADEALVAVRAARAAGVRRLLVSHPEARLNAVPLEVQQSLVRAGALLERCLVSTDEQGGTDARRRCGADPRHRNHGQSPVDRLRPAGDPHPGIGTGAVSGSARGARILQGRVEATRWDEQRRPAGSRLKGARVGKRGGTIVPLYYDADADSTVLRDRKIAIVGYGKQGRALNLRDSGYDVRMGNRPGGCADFAHAYGVASSLIAEAADWASMLGLITSASDLQEDGRFARDWAIEHTCGGPHVCRLRRQALDHPFNSEQGRLGCADGTGESVKIAFSLGLAVPLKEGPGRPSRRLETRVLDWAAGQGFDGVDVTDTWTPFYDLAESELLALRRAVESRGLRILALNCFRKILPGPDEAALARVASAAAVLGVRVATVALFPPRGQSPQTAWNEAVQAVARLVRDGGGTVNWSIELHDGGYTATADACLRFIEQVGHETVGVNPDLGNWLRSAAPTAAAGWRGQLQTLASRANAWHVKNYRSLPTGGTLPAALPDGDIDYRWSLDVMREAGFAGPVVLEGAREGDALACARGRAYLTDLVQQWPAPRGVEGSGSRVGNNDGSDGSPTGGPARLP